MNEVRLSPTAVIMQPNGSSSKGAKDVPSPPPSQEGGNTLPPDSAVGVVDQASSVKGGPAADLNSGMDDALSSMNEYVQSVHRDLHFTVDQESQRTVVKVIDGDSGEVIRQIPDEIFLELARRLNDDGEFNFLNELG